MFSLQIPSIVPMRRVNEALPKEERMFDSEEAWAHLERQLIDVSDVSFTKIDEISNNNRARKVWTLSPSEELTEPENKSVRQVHNIEIETYNFFAEFNHLQMPKMYYGYRYEKDVSDNIYFNLT